MAFHVLSDCPQRLGVKEQRAASSSPVPAQYDERMRIIQEARAPGKTGSPPKEVPSTSGRDWSRRSVANRQLALQNPERESPWGLSRSFSNARLRICRIRSRVTPSNDPISSSVRSSPSSRP